MKLYMIDVRDRGQDALRSTGQWYWTLEAQSAAVDRLRATGRCASVVARPPIEVDPPHAEDLDGWLG